MTPEAARHDDEPPEAEGEDALDRFRSWHGFLVASLAVNALFVYGMLANVADPSVRTWFKTLVWLPFNAIATAVYLALAVRLAPGRGGMFLAILCGVVALSNWVIMWAAGH